MQVTIARQLGLEPTTVGNFFMNARRRSHDKWREGPEGDDQDIFDEDDDVMGSNPHGTIMEDDENVKYEVYDNGMNGGYTAQEQAFLEATGGMPGAPGVMDQDPSGGYHMTAIPGPVHNPHNQIHSYPSSCA